MNAIRARLAALVAAFLLSALAARGVAEVTPELAARLEGWLDGTFELLLLVGYAVVHPWLERRLNGGAGRGGAR